jgi:hypothetical protein
VARLNVLYRSRERSMTKELGRFVKHTLQVPTELWNQVRERAKLRCITISELIRKALRLFLIVDEAIHPDPVTGATSQIIIRRADGTESPIIFL